MTKAISKKEIDRLGERLKSGEFDESDLALLDDYRDSITAAHEYVIKTIEDQFKLKVTGRPLKTTDSIAQKLRRQTIQLSKIQDIAGCRVKVADIEKQNQLVQALQTVFEETRVVDRRVRPSNNYRAVHVVARYQGQQLEIQVRTSLQQTWAELSEKCYDVIDPAIKYGKGDEFILKALANFSRLVAAFETVEHDIFNITAANGSLTNKLSSLEHSMPQLKQAISEALLVIIEKIEELRR